MECELEITAHARKQIKKLPRAVQQKIRAKVDDLCAAPFSGRQDVKKLKGRCGYRLRVGSYRISMKLILRGW